MNVLGTIKDIIFEIPARVSSYLTNGLVFLHHTFPQEVISRALSVRPDPEPLTFVSQESPQGLSSGWSGWAEAGFQQGEGSIQTHELGTFNGRPENLVFEAGTLGYGEVRLCAILASSSTQSLDLYLHFVGECHFLNRDEVSSQTLANVLNLKIDGEDRTLYNFEGEGRSLRDSTYSLYRNNASDRALTYVYRFRAADTQNADVDNRFLQGDSLGLVSFNIVSRVEDAFVFLGSNGVYNSPDAQGIPASGHANSPLRISGGVVSQGDNRILRVENSGNAFILYLEEEPRLLRIGDQMLVSINTRSGDDLIDMGPSSTDVVLTLTQKGIRQFGGMVYYTAMFLNTPLTAMANINDIILNPIQIKLFTRIFQPVAPYLHIPQDLPITVSVSRTGHTVRAYLEEGIQIGTGALRIRSPLTSPVGETNSTLIFPAGTIGDEECRIAGFIISRSTSGLGVLFEILFAGNPNRVRASNTLPLTFYMGANRTQVTINLSFSGIASRLGSTSTYATRGDDTSTRVEGLYLLSTNYMGRGSEDDFINRLGQSDYDLGAFGYTVTVPPVMTMALSGNTVPYFGGYLESGFALEGAAPRASTLGSANSDLTFDAGDLGVEALRVSGIGRDVTSSDPDATSTITTFQSIQSDGMTTISSSNNTYRGYWEDGLSLNSAAGVPTDGTGGKRVGDLEINDGSNAARILGFLTRTDGSRLEGFMLISSNSVSSVNSINVRINDLAISIATVNVLIRWARGQAYVERDNPAGGTSTNIYYVYMHTLPSSVNDALLNGERVDIVSFGSPEALTLPPVSQEMIPLNKNSIFFTKNPTDLNSDDVLRVRAETHSVTHTAQVNQKVTLAETNRSLQGLGDVAYVEEGFQASLSDSTSVVDEQIGEVTGPLTIEGENDSMRIVAISITNATETRPRVRVFTKGRVSELRGFFPLWLRINGVSYRVQGELSLPSTRAGARGTRGDTSSSIEADVYSLSDRLYTSQGDVFFTGGLGANPTIEIIMAGDETDSFHYALPEVTATITETVPNHIVSSRITSSEAEETEATTYATRGNTNTSRIKLWSLPLDSSLNETFLNNVRVDLLDFRKGMTTERPEITASTDRNLSLISSSGRTMYHGYWERGLTISSRQNATNPKSGSTNSPLEIPIGLDSTRMVRILGLVAREDLSDKTFIYANLDPREDTEYSWYIRYKIGESSFDSRMGRNFIQTNHRAFAFSERGNIASRRILIYQNVITGQALREAVWNGTKIELIGFHTGEREGPPEVSFETDSSVTTTWGFGEGFYFERGVRARGSFNHPRAVDTTGHTDSPLEIPIGLDSKETIRIVAFAVLFSRFSRIVFIKKPDMLAKKAWRMKWRIRGETTERLSNIGWQSDSNDGYSDFARYSSSTAGSQWSTYERRGDATSPIVYGLTSAGLTIPGQGNSTRLLQQMENGGSIEILGFDTETENELPYIVSEDERPVTEERVGYSEYGFTDQSLDSLSAGAYILGHGDATPEPTPLVDANNNTLFGYWEQGLTLDHTVTSQANSTGSGTTNSPLEIPEGFSTSGTTRILGLAAAETGGGVFVWLNKASYQGGPWVLTVTIDGVRTHHAFTHGSRVHSNTAPFTLRPITNARTYIRRGDATSGHTNVYGGWFTSTNTDFANALRSSSPKRIESISMRIINGRTLNLPDVSGDPTSLLERGTTNSLLEIPVGFNEDFKTRILSLRARRTFPLNPECQVYVNNSQYVGGKWFLNYKIYPRTENRYQLTTEFVGGRAELTDTLVGINRSHTSDADANYYSVKNNDSSTRTTGASFFTFNSLPIANALRRINNDRQWILPQTGAATLPLSSSSNITIGWWWRGLRLSTSGSDDQSASGTQFGDLIAINSSGNNVRLLGLGVDSSDGVHMWILRDISPVDNIDLVVYISGVEQTITFGPTSSDTDSSVIVSPDRTASEPSRRNSPVYRLRPSGTSDGLTALLSALKTTSTNDEQTPAIELKSLGDYIFEPVGSVYAKDIPRIELRSLQYGDSSKQYIEADTKRVDGMRWRSGSGNDPEDWQRGYWEFNLDPTRYGIVTPESGVTNGNLTFNDGTKDIRLVGLTTRTVAGSFVFAWFDKDFGGTDDQNIVVTVGGTQTTINMGRVQVYTNSGVLWPERDNTVQYDMYSNLINSRGGVYYATFGSEVLRDALLDGTRIQIDSIGGHTMPSTGWQTELKFPTVEDYTSVTMPEVTGVQINIGMPDVNVIGKSVSEFESFDETRTSQLPDAPPPSETSTIPQVTRGSSDFSLPMVQPPIVSDSENPEISPSLDRTQPLERNLFGYYEAGMGDETHAATNRAHGNTNSPLEIPIGFDPMHSTRIMALVAPNNTSDLSYIYFDRNPSLASQTWHLNVIIGGQSIAIELEESGRSGGLSQDTRITGYTHRNRTHSPRISPYRSSLRNQRLHNAILAGTSIEILGVSQGTTRVPIPPVTRVFYYQNLIDYLIIYKLVFRTPQGLRAVETSVYLGDPENPYRIAGGVLRLPQRPDSVYYVNVPAIRLGFRNQVVPPPPVIPDPPDPDDPPVEPDPPSPPPVVRTEIVSYQYNLVQRQLLSQRQALSQTSNLLNAQSLSGRYRVFSDRTRSIRRNSFEYAMGGMFLAESEILTSGRSRSGTDVNVIFTKKSGSFSRLTLNKDRYSVDSSKRTYLSFYGGSLYILNNSRIYRTSITSTDSGVIFGPINSVGRINSTREHGMVASSDGITVLYFTSTQQNPALRYRLYHRNHSNESPVTVSFDPYAQFSSPIDIDDTEPPELIALNGTYALGGIHVDSDNNLTEEYVLFDYHTTSILTKRASQPASLRGVDYSEDKSLMKDTDVSGFDARVQSYTDNVASGRDTVQNFRYGFEFITSNTINPVLDGTSLSQLILNSKPLNYNNSRLHLITPEGRVYTLPRALSGHDFTVSGVTAIRDGAINGEVMYLIGEVSDTLGVYAANYGQGSRASSSDINLHADNQDPRAIEADSLYVYVADGDGVIYVYDRAQGDAQLEIQMDALNNNPQSMELIGNTLYVFDGTLNKVFCYLMNGERVSHLEIDLNQLNLSRESMTRIGGVLYFKDGDKMTPIPYSEAAIGNYFELYDKLSDVPFVISSSIINPEVPDITPVEIVTRDVVQTDGGGGDGVPIGGGRETNMRVPLGGGSNQQGQAPMEGEVEEEDIIQEQITPEKYGTILHLIGPYNGTFSMRAGRGTDLEEDITLTRGQVKTFMFKDMWRQKE